MPIRMSRRGLLFVVSSLLFVLSQFYRAAVAVISPQLMSDLSLDARQLSLMSAAFFYTFAGMQIPIAVYLDRIGPRRTMIALNLVAVLGALIFAGADSAAGLVTARGLLGIGMACNLMGTFKLLAVWFGPGRFATLTAVVFSMGTAGNIMAATPLVLLAQAVGWRMAFVFIAAANLLLIAAFALAVPARPHALSTAESRRSDAAGMRPALAALMELLRLRDYWIISLGTFVRYGVYAAIQTLYAGPFLMQVAGLPAVAAGNVILLMNVGFICGGPIFGAISDRGVRSRKRVVAPGLTAMAVVVAVLALLPVHAGLPVLAALFFLLGLVNSTGGIMYSHIKERMPPEKSGTAMTGINFFTMIGPAVFLQALGLFMQAWFPAASLGAAAFDAAFGVCAASLLMAAILYGFTRDTGNGA